MIEVFLMLALIIPGLVIYLWYRLNQLEEKYENLYDLVLINIEKEEE